ncbi:unnamed protein product, partial [Mesorhabditis spiculigera]
MKFLVLAALVAVGAATVFNCDNTCDFQTLSIDDTMQLNTLPGSDDPSNPSCMVVNAACGAQDDQILINDMMPVMPTVGQNGIQLTCQQQQWFFEDVPVSTLSCFSTQPAGGF